LRQRLSKILKIGGIEYYSLHQSYMCDFEQPPIRLSPSPEVFFCGPKDKKSAIQRDKNANSLSDSYKRIILDFEESKPSSINIVSVAKDYGIQHRRVYDLFNLLTALGICQSVERGKLSWNGIGSINKVIREAYSNIEGECITKPFRSVFCLGPSPSLGSIATHFLCMYLYFGVDTLLLRQVSSIFHDPRSDIKSLERRMYLVLNFLEIMGIVAHTLKTNEYKLVWNLSEPKRYGLLKRCQIIDSQSPHSIERLLNHIDCNYEYDVYSERARQFPMLLN